MFKKTKKDTALKENSDFMVKDSKDSPLSLPSKFKKKKKKKKTKQPNAENRPLENCFCCFEIVTTYFSNCQIFKSVIKFYILILTFLCNLNVILQEFVCDSLCSHVCIFRSLFFFFIFLLLVVVGGKIYLRRFSDYWTFLYFLRSYLRSYLRSIDTYAYLRFFHIYFFPFKK